MDYDHDTAELTPVDEYDFAKAKQRASVLWLVSKAHNNRVPPELRDPFYRDHEDQERLKPQIGQGLASAELYCLALANIYADPNYHSLSHQGVVGALQRKGVDLEPPEDRTPLTETVLAQTAPLRMSAHMAVIGGIMDLYVKEVLIPIKVFEVVRRFAAVGYPEEVPVDAEDAALLWLNKCSVKMRHRIEDQLGTCHSDPRDGRHQGRPLVPHIPVVQDLGELSDGCALASLLSFYCPSFLPWEDLCLNEPMSLADSLYNLQLAQRFCDQHLPHDVCFLSVEDVLFVHPSVRQNLLALLADLMYLFEIRPAKCVRRPGLRHDQEAPSPQHCLQVARHNGESLRKARALQNSCSHIPDLLCATGESHSEQHNGAWPEHPQGGSKNDGGTSRAQRSLLARDERDSDPLSSSPKSRCRSDEEEERAGRPSLRRRPSGGPEPLQPARLREAKERQNREPKHAERGEDSPSMPVEERPPDPSPPRTSRPEPGLRRSASRSELSSRGSPLRRNPSGTDLFRPSLSRSASQTDVRGSPPRRKTLESYYDQLGGAESLQRTAGYPLRKESSLSHMYNFSGEKAALEMSDPFETDMFAQQREKRTTSFAQLSRAKEEPSIHIVYSREAPRGAPERAEEGPLAARLGAVRLKLEERRSKIEREKRRLEERVKRQRQQAGQAAFLQAVGRAEARRVPSPPQVAAPLGDAEADVDAVRRKWLGRNGSASDESSPRSEELDLEGCVSTVERLDSSLTDLEADIGRIERQQRAIRDLVHGAPSAPARFFLHEAQPESLPPPDLRAGDAAPPLSLPPQLAPAFQFQPARRQWGQFQPEQHWGPPVVALAEQPHSRPQWGPSVTPFGEYLLYPTEHGAPSGTFQVSQQPPAYGQPRQNGADQRGPYPGFPADPYPCPPFGVAPPPFLAPPEVPPALPVPEVEPLERHEPSERRESSVVAGPEPPKEGPRRAFGQTYRVSRPKGGDEAPRGEAGFFVCLDDQQPRKPKPRLRPRIAAQDPEAPRETPMDRPDGAEGSQEPKTGAAALGFVIGADLVNPDPEAETEMQRRKELIMMVSLRRREEQEASRLAKEQRNALKRMQEQLKREEQERKREEERQRRQQILEQYRQRKAREEADKEGAEAPPGSSPRGGTLTRPSKSRSSSRPRPKSVHLGTTAPGLRGSQASLDESGRGDETRRAPSPPCGEASWQRGGSDASETASAGSGSLQLLLPLGDYTGPKLFVKPAAKSNRGIVLNALNTVLAGQVNADTKRRVLEEMGVSDSKHFLILFRDAGCQFRGLYSYQPEREEVGRLFGVGPRTVTAPMMDLFFKYNSGAKSFSRIHTKHLTVTIDAFTIHNSLWAAKRAPRKDS